MKQKYHYIIFCFLLMPLALSAASETIGDPGGTSSDEGFHEFDGKNNLIAQGAVMTEGFKLQDTLTTCSYRSLFHTRGMMALEGGTLFLNTDLYFRLPYELNSGGIIIGNDFSMHLPCDAPNILGHVGCRGTLSQSDQVNPGDIVYTVDWNADNQHIGVGMDEHGSTELEVWSFSSGSLALAASAEIGANVYSLRWDQNSNRLAIGVDAAAADELQAYLFTAPATLTQTSAITIGATVNAVAFNPAGTFLAYGTGSSLEVRTFSAGTIGAATTDTAATTGAISRNAIAWSPDGKYIVVGTATNLHIFSFDGATLTSVVSKSFGAAVNSVAWSPTEDLIVIGLATAPRLQLYSFNRTTNVITQRATDDGVRTHNSVHWSPDGDCVIVATTSGPGPEFFNFAVIGSGQLLVNFFDANFPNDVNEVRWSPNGDFIAVGTVGPAANRLRVYTNTQSLAPYTLDRVKLCFDTDLTVSLPIHIQGECLFDGNGSIMDLLPSASIVIRPQGKLLMRNVILRGMRGTNLRCLDSLGTVTFENVVMELDSNFSFTQGYLAVEHLFSLVNAHTFAFTAAQPLVIKDQARLRAEESVTFSYAPTVARKNLIVMETSASSFELENATLHVTHTGLQLTKGILRSEGKSLMISEGRNKLEGIIFGDGTPGNDLSVETVPAATLDLTRGFLTNRNVT